MAWDDVADGDLKKSGIQWTWNDTYLDKNGIKQKIDWSVIGKLAKKYNMVWAGTWTSFPEYPHCQDSYGFNINDLYRMLINDGLPSVWKKIESTIKPKTNMVVV